LQISLLQLNILYLHEERTSRGLHSILFVLKIDCNSEILLNDYQIIHTYCMLLLYISFTVLLIYVDDILLTENNLTRMQRLKNCLL